MVESLCWSRRLRGLEPITKLQPTLRWHAIGDREFEESNL
jgi:hypothetical protein